VNVAKALRAAIHYLPTLRTELASAVTSAVTLVGVFEFTFPQISTAHLVGFSTLTATLTGVVAFLNNSKVVAEFDSLGNLVSVRGPKERLRTLVRHAQR